MKKVRSAAARALRIPQFGQRVEVQRKRRSKAGYTKHRGFLM
jgi:hypothetical protein